MEANTAAIVRLGWARWLGLPDDALEGADDTPLRVVDNTQAMVVRLWRRHVVVGPAWLHEEADDPDVPALTDQSALLRRCEGRSARLLGQATLAFTDRYVELPGLSEIPVSPDPQAARRLERRCPPDDVTEVGLAGMSRVLVTLDEADVPLAGAGYEEWRGILGHLGVLTDPDHRRAGHGTRAAAIAVDDALDSGLVPQWRARVGNVASRRLARRLGFTEVGSQTTVLLTAPTERRVR